VAVSAGAARRFVQCRRHQLGGPIGRVPAHRPRRGGQAVGREEGQAQHELRQAEPGSQVSLCTVSVHFVYPTK